MPTRTNISILKDCYGCGVCEFVCPQRIINLKLDNSGFYHPQITNFNKCTSCGACLRVCSYNNSISKKTKPDYEVVGYAGWSKNPDIRQACSTGGVAFEIARHLINQGYHACGVRYNTKNERAEHFLADTVDAYLPSIGSKYLQSYTIPGFSCFNRSDKYVVVGSPCQIASLRKYIRLRHIEQNFVLIDFFCHGVPSMNMWKKYLRYIRSKHSLCPDIVDWRNKERGWHDSWVMSFKKVGESGYSLTSNIHDGDLFYDMFLFNRCLNKPCYTSCKYKMVSSAADIRIGDFWGKQYAGNEKGVNGILALTFTGKEVLNSIDSIELVKEPVVVVLEGQMRQGPKRDYIAVIDNLLLKTPLSIASISRINRIVPKILLPLLVVRAWLKK